MTTFAPISTFPFPTWLPHPPQQLESLWMEALHCRQRLHQFQHSRFKPGCNVRRKNGKTLDGGHPLLITAVGPTFPFRTWPPRLSSTIGGPLDGRPSFFLWSTTGSSSSLSSLTLLSPACDSVSNSAVLLLLVALLLRLFPPRIFFCTPPTTWPTNSVSGSSFSSFCVRLFAMAAYVLMMSWQYFFGDFFLCDAVWVWMWAFPRIWFWMMVYVVRLHKTSLMFACTIVFILEITLLSVTCTQ